MATLNVNSAIHGLIEQLKLAQSPNGTWEYPFETGVATDAYMIILLRTLEINDEELIRNLTNRILSRQEENGAWKLFEDEGEGNITATTEAYYSLLYSGYYEQSHPRMELAKQFIIANGGLNKIHMFSKIMLCLTGQLRWPETFPIPIELMLLPSTSYVNFFSFSVFGRANLCPMMILADQKYSLKTAKSPDLADLYNRDDEVGFNELFNWRPISKMIEQGLTSFVGLPKRMKKIAIQKAKQYIIDRIEADGTLLNYFSSTFLMIFALLALGHSKNDPLITNAVSGLLNMQTKIDGYTHIQYTTATVWNTGLISTALQEAGVHPENPVVKQANIYLLSQQHTKFGDWQIHNREGKPGGWGFSNLNSIHPDVDDTTVALRALARSVRSNRDARLAWEKGIQWLVSMQNRDGGWPAFERNVTGKFVKLLPIKNAEFLIADPSTADLTGRTLQFFGNYTQLKHDHPVIKNAIYSLLNQQENNGAWYGRWGICYLYGTWAALTGLTSVGITSKHPSIKKAIGWLKQQQNADGGWGESCQSDIEKRYVPLGSSTITDTAWAVDALIAASPVPTKEITNGIEFILKRFNQNDWTTEYPKGQGMAGDFYMHYHSYRYIFPLFALTNYRNKYN
ncbi:squalene--hopene cyclase [Bacillus marasmi]|uniref:squalene--hopene cyclase n=1 Tax=Bacillus marasmi TaxID=1926279 RepID=UPI0011C92740|nr:squalene--hopene cyclase [Bacillus marasmi]